jgi:hypothetical protein
MSTDDEVRVVVADAAGVDVVSALGNCDAEAFCDA